MTVDLSRSAMLCHALTCLVTASGCSLNKRVYVELLTYPFEPYLSEQLTKKQL